MRDFEPKKMKAITFTGIRRVLEKANKMAAEGRNVVHFEIGQPDFVTPKYIRDAACEALQAGNTRYTSNYGIDPLRAAIAEKLRLENKIPAEASNVMVTVGGEEAMAAAILALVDAGDEVLLSDPGYSPYADMVSDRQGHLVSGGSRVRQGRLCDPDRRLRALGAVDRKNRPARAVPCARGGKSRRD